jgi:excisionase family DNA binding protein
MAPKGVGMTDQMQVIPNTGEQKFDRLLWAAEVAEVLGVSRNRAYLLMASGELPSLRIGRSVRVRKDALNKWLEDQERAARDIAI